MPRGEQPVNAGRHQILDRNSIANARLGGLEKDLHLTDVQYQTALMILFVGFPFRPPSFIFYADETDTRSTPQPGYILCMVYVHPPCSIISHLPTQTLQHAPLHCQATLLYP